jgi:hypothetical protein
MTFYIMASIRGGPVVHYLTAFEPPHGVWGDGTCLASLGYAWTCVDMRHANYLHRLLCTDYVQLVL